MKAILQRFFLATAALGALRQAGAGGDQEAPSPVEWALKHALVESGKWLSGKRKALTRAFLKETALERAALARLGALVKLGYIDPLARRTAHTKTGAIVTAFYVAPAAKRAVQFAAMVALLFGSYLAIDMTAPPPAHAVRYAMTGATDGVSLSQAGTPQGFFGFAALQPTNPTQAAASFALGMSAVVTYNIAQTPAAVNANTTVEQALTVTGVKTGSAIFVNRASAPTGAQGGVGIVGARISSPNTVQVNYCNVTAGNITPTAENYWFCEVRGPLVQTVALTFTAATPTLSTFTYIVSTSAAASSVTGTGVQGLSSAQVASQPTTVQAGNPANVPPNFTLTNPNNTTPIYVNEVASQMAGAAVISGMPQTVIANKASGQAGLGYWVWVAGNRQLGISCSNTSGAGITPTNETWTLFSCRGVALGGQVVHYLVNVGTPGAAAATDVTTYSLTVNGVQAGQYVYPPLKPTFQTHIIPGSVASTPTANTVVASVIAPNAAGATPTASEVWDFPVDVLNTGLGGNQSGTVLAQFNGTAAIGALAAITGVEIGVAVVGILNAAPVHCNVSQGPGFATSLGSQLPAGVIFGGARASANGTISLNFLNVTANAIAAATAGTAQFTALQGPQGISGSASGAAGSGVVYPMDNQKMQLAENTQADVLASAIVGLQLGS